MGDAERQQEMLSGPGLRQAGSMSQERTEGEGLCLCAAPGDSHRRGRQRTQKSDRNMDELETNANKSEQNANEPVHIGVKFQQLVLFSTEYSNQMQNRMTHFQEKGLSE